MADLNLRRKDGSMLVILRYCLYGLGDTFGEVSEQKVFQRGDKAFLVQRNKFWSLANRNTEERNDIAFLLRYFSERIIECLCKLYLQTFRLECYKHVVDEE